MSDYGTMQSRIATEVLRDDINSEIQDAIQTAIDVYQSQPLWFLQGYSTTITTTASTRTVDLPTDLSDLEYITNVKMRVGSSTDYDLENYEFSTLEKLNNGDDFYGIPVFYSVYQGLMYLYPIPDSGNYTLLISYYKRLSTLSGTSDTNAWMTDGERLIRYKAKAMLYHDVLMDERRAERFHVMADGGMDFGKGVGGELARLLRKTNQRAHSPRIQPYI